MSWPCDGGGRLVGPGLGIRSAVVRVGLLGVILAWDDLGIRGIVLIRHRSRQGIELGGSCERLGWKSLGLFSVISWYRLGTTGAGTLAALDKRLGTKKGQQMRLGERANTDFGDPMP